MNRACSNCWKRFSTPNALRKKSALKSEPDLAPLRSREDFQKLVQEVQRKGKN
jgi:hypothetical protein